MLCTSTPLTCARGLCQPVHSLSVCKSGLSSSSRLGSSSNGTKHFHIQGKEISWDVLRRCLQREEIRAARGEWRKCPKLSTKAVDLTNFSKMTVSLAKAIFDRTTLAEIETACDERDRMTLVYLRSCALVFDIILSPVQVRTNCARIVCNHHT